MLVTTITVMTTTVIMPMTATTTVIMTVFATTTMTKKMTKK